MKKKRKTKTMKMKTEQNLHKLNLLFVVEYQIRRKFVASIRPRSFGLPFVSSTKSNKSNISSPPRILCCLFCLSCERNREKRKKKKQMKMYNYCESIRSKSWRNFFSRCFSFFSGFAVSARCSVTHPTDYMHTYTLTISNLTSLSCQTT